MKRLAPLVALALALAAARVSAQQVIDSGEGIALERGATETPAIAPAQASADAAATPLREAVKALRFDADALERGTRAIRTAAPRRQTTSRVVATAVAGVAGFFAGGYIGARIDGDCGGCDDPGFVGAIIGAPVGAAAAAIATWIWSGKD